MLVANAKEFFIPDHCSLFCFPVTLIEICTVKCTDSVLPLSPSGCTPRSPLSCQAGDSDTRWQQWPSDPSSSQPRGGWAFPRGRLPGAGFPPPSPLWGSPSILHRARMPEHQCAELLYAGVVPCVRTTPRLQHLKAKEKIHVLGWAFGEALTEQNSLEGGEHGILQKTFKAAYKPYQHASVEILFTSILFFSLLYYCAVVL